VSATVAFAWRPLLIGSGPLFPFDAALPIDGTVLLLSGALGCIAGGVAGLLSTLLYRIEDVFHRLPVHWMWWPALGAVIVGVGGLIEPRVLGAGYDSIQDLLDGRLVLAAMVLLFAAKAVVWLIALGSGTSGGVLAPLLILGGPPAAAAGHGRPAGGGRGPGLGWA